jgi:hypothetical protein
MSLDSEIIVVSGLPRSGTSLMMQMLECAGIKIVTDGLRTADEDNPRGYFEYEAVKSIKQDASWLPATRGKAFKMISQLLYDLPLSERYRIIFMERDIDEVLSSQETMLQRRNRVAVEREQMKQSYALHLERLHEWLQEQPGMQVLRVSYNDLVDHSERESLRVSDFLSGTVDAMQMVSVVSPALYRVRNRLQP